MPSEWNSGNPGNSAPSSGITRPRGSRAKKASAATEKDIQRKRPKLCVAPGLL